MPNRDAISRKHKLGQPPGALLYTGTPRDAKATFSMISYNEKTQTAHTYNNLERCLEGLTDGSVHWLNIEGLHDTDLVASIGERFGIHPLTLEDVLNTQTRPKFEDYEGYLVAILKMIRFDPTSQEVVTEQLVLILKDQMVITFQEKDGEDAFDHVRHRIKSVRGRIHKLGADYLYYALMDAVVDYYFEVLERIGDMVETLEEALIEGPSPEMMRQLHHLKRKMILLRKSVWPLRELINNMERSDNPQLTEHTHLYLRDLRDHIVLVLDTVETYRDLLSGLMDLYLSSVSNRMNEVMKVLAIISTVFIPVTFLAGVYGMNFDIMPELHEPRAYYILWTVMIVLMVSQVIYFKKRKWL